MHIYNLGPELDTVDFNHLCGSGNTPLCPSACSFTEAHFLKAFHSFCAHNKSDLWTSELSSQFPVLLSCNGIRCQPDRSWSLHEVKTYWSKEFSHTSSMVCSLPFCPEIDQECLGLLWWPKLEIDLQETPYTLLTNEQTAEHFPSELEVVRHWIM